MTEAVSSAAYAHAAAPAGALPDFTVDKKNFLRSLAHVQSVVEKRGTIPILANVKITAAPGEILLTATDMDIALTERFEASVDSEGALTVPAHTLYEIVRKMPDDASIRCAPEENGAAMSVVSGRCAFSLPVLPADQFPVIEQEEAYCAFPLLPAELIQLIDKTQSSMSTEQTRFYLNGIYFLYEEREDGGALVAAATDGHRLAKAEIPAPEGCADMDAVIVPRKTVHEARKIAEEQTEPVTVRVSQGKISFAFASGTLISKLVEGNFPQYKQALPQQEQHMMQIYKEHLGKAIDRVSTVATDKTRAIYMTVTAGEMTLRAKSEANSAAEEQIEVSYDGPDAEIVFNYRYITDVLATVDGDTAQFYFSDPREAVVIRDPVCEGVLYVIMPMRL